MAALATTSGWWRPSAGPPGPSWRGPARALPPAPPGRG